MDSQAAPRFRELADRRIFGEEVVNTSRMYT